MTHPLLDECSIPMAAHSAEVRRSRQLLACPPDPAGAPSGLRWMLHSAMGETWSLREVTPGRSGPAVGHVWRIPEWSDRKRRWVRCPGPLPRPRYQTPHAAARALVREVRRG